MADNQSMSPHYLTPPDEQVQCNAAKLMKLETPWLDGIMHQVMSAMKFMQ
jgi:hypothetical protein